MKKTSVVAILLGCIFISSCKKETVFTPNTNESLQSSTITEDETEQINNLKITDPRQKFVGTYVGTSSTSVINGQQTIAGTRFKFIVSKIVSTTNKVKIIVVINNGSPQSYTATASTNNLSFSGGTGPANISQSINMSKTSSSAVPTKFTFTTGGGFTGLTSTYLIMVPRKN